MFWIHPLIIIVSCGQILFCAELLSLAVAIIITIIWTSLRTTYRLILKWNWLDMDRLKGLNSASSIYVLCILPITIIIIAIALATYTYPYVSLALLDRFFFCLCVGEKKKKAVWLATPDYQYYYYYQIYQFGTGRHTQKAQTCTRCLPIRSYSQLLAAVNYYIRIYNCDRRTMQDLDPNISYIVHH